MTAYEQIRASLPTAPAGRREPAPFGVIEITGPEAVEFLHRLCSQDVVAMAPGSCAPAAFLTPKGKLVTTAVVARGGDRLWVEVQRDRLDGLHELLDRYHFTEKLALRRRDDWSCAEVLGVDLPGGLHPEPGQARGLTDGVELAGRRRGVVWLRRHGPAARLVDFAAGLPALDPGLAECLRIVGGLVRVGVDTEEGTLALEADLDDHVSTTKGCYTGQEIVARIHTYGHVNRRLALLRIATREPVERGATLVDADGEPIGRVMSSAAIPGSPDSVALGYLPDAFLAEPEPLALGARGGPMAQVEPFVPQ